MTGRGAFRGIAETAMKMPPWIGLARRRCAGAIAWVSDFAFTA